MKKINFVTVANEMIASYRYHNRMPAEALARLGYEVALSAFPTTADVYVFTKHFNYGDYWYMSGVMANGHKGVFHCCDYHFDTKHRDHYRKMIDLADVVISSTPEMASLIKMETGRESTIIPDMYEMEEKEPEFNPTGKLKILWYGHNSNLDGLMDVYPDIKDYDLMLCTMPGVPKPLDKAGMLPYSKENLKKAFAWCDVVIIPSKSETRKLVKSHNRLTEAVRQGKFVIANALPSYREFEDSMYIGNIAEGLKWIQTQSKEEIESRIKTAQGQIVEKYNPQKIGKMWEVALSV